MARIRTIKPDFWTDERLTECSLSARLLFIGLWNFADDAGNLQRSARKLKMQIFPADTIDCEPLIQELMTHGVLREYSVNGENFLNIKNFAKHQIVNRPSKSNIPVPDFSEDSLSAHGVLTEGREGKGMEGKGREKDIYVGQTENAPLELTPDAPNPATKPPKSRKAEASDSARRVLDFLNAKTGKAFRPVPVNLSLICARLDEGATEQDCKSVIARKFRDWKDDVKMRDYLRPATLFNREKFAQYQGQLVAPTEERQQ